MGSDDLFKKQKSKRKQRKIENKIRSKLTVYIFTEGTKTETNYFKSLEKNLKKDSNFKSIVNLVGVGWSTKSLLRYVETTLSKSNMPVDSKNVWLVFDKDDFDDFNNAIMEAKEKGYSVAWSNECFELWYILHYEYLNSGISRKDYRKKIEKYIGCEYEKNSEEMFDLTYSNIDTAIKNSKKLVEEYSDKIDANKFDETNPCTKVYELVEFLDSLKNK